MYTFSLQLGLQLLADRSVAAVFGTSDYVAESNDIANSEAKLRADARLLPLGDNGLEKVAKLKFCTFPMKGRAGLFEIRVEGVRYYGGRIGNSDGKQIYVLAGAENKAGRDEANAALLDRCVKTLKDLTEKLTKANAIKPKGPSRRR